MNNRPINAQAIVGGSALVCLLVYTWSHTAGLLSAYADPPAVGYIAATGVEIAVVWLSLRIGQARNRGKRARGLTLVLVAVAGVSVLANVANGYEVAFGQVFTGVNVRSVDWLQAFVGVVATALIPALVFAIANVIGADAREAERKQQTIAHKQSVAVPDAPEQNAAPFMGEQERVQSEQTPEQWFSDLVTANPDASYREIGAAMRRSIATVKPLADRAGWRKNGHGWELNDATQS